MNTAVTDNKPWYKQFWFWFVVGIPACSVVMGITLVYVATQNKVSIVKEEWYKDGLAINQRIDKQLKAREMGLTAAIDFNRETEALTIDMPALDASEMTIALTLVHPTSEDGDKQLTLTRTPEGVFWSKMPADSKGFYYLQLSNEALDWQMDGAINFNNQQVSANLTAE